MKRSFFLALTLALVAFLSLGSATALAHGEPSISVDPMTVKPGDTIKVHAESIADPNGTVDVRLIGGPNTVNKDLGTSQAGDDGDFDGTYTVPMDLASGSYQIQATGKITLSADLTIIGGTASTGADAAPLIQQRSFGETAALVALFGVLAGLGLFFARLPVRKTQG